MADNKTLLVASAATVAAGAAAAFVVTSKKKVAVLADMKSLEDVVASASPESLELPEGTTFDTFSNKDGLSIHTKALKASSQPPKAAAVIVHGVGEHSSRPGYGRLYLALSKAGVDAHSMDHQGHGLSGGERGYVAHYSKYIEDVETHCRSVMEELGGGDGKKAPPLFLIGQSMGANIAAHVALRLADSNIPVAGMVLTSPMMGVDMDIVLKIQDFFGAFLDKAVPKAKLVDGVRPEDLSRDEEEVELYRKDPLNYHGKLRVHTALCLMWGMEAMKEKRGGVSCPILLLHGSDDKTTSLPSALDFFDSVSTPRESKKMVRLVDMKHEAFNEFGKEAVVDMVVEFVTGLKLPTGDKPRSEGSDIDGVIELDLTPPSSSKQK